MDIAQSFGSSSSYARKYALNGLFLIDDTKDADSTNTHGKTKEKKKLNASTFKNALEMIANGEYTAEKLKDNYALTPKQLEQL